MGREDEARARWGNSTTRTSLSLFMACSGGFTLVFRGRVRLGVHAGQQTELDRRIFPAQGNRELPTRFRTESRVSTRGRLSFFQSIRVATNVQRDSVMQYPVEDGGLDDSVAEHLALGTGALVSGQDHRSALIPAADITWKIRFAPWSPIGLQPITCRRQASESASLRLAPPIKLQIAGARSHPA